MEDKEKSDQGQEQQPTNDSQVAIEVDPEKQERGPSREELIDALQKSREEAKALREKMLRVLADIDNQRKRLAREREEIIKFGNEKLIRDLLPVLDNLERSLEHLPKETEDQSLMAFRNGVQMVLNQMLSVLQGYGVKQLSAIGKPFDPQYHEALERRTAPDLPEDTIIEEIAKGYMLHERLLRPSLVVVSTKTEEENKNPSELIEEGKIKNGEDNRN